MGNIVLRELLTSDNIKGLVEKVNFNFDQLLLTGGPEGPQGPQGIEGPAGIRGIRGNEWITNNNGTLTDPTDGLLRENDQRLDPDGTIFSYLSGAWVDTGINLRGPAGPQGVQGNGSITIIPAQVSTGGFIVPNVSLSGRLNIADFLSQIDNLNDRDNSSTISGAEGLDYILLGTGNNSLVLGHYDSLFNTNGTTDPKINFWPQEESDVPMLVIAQNDYKDPTPGTAFDTLSDFKNGISIGLSTTHDSYDSIYENVENFNSYDAYTNLSIINRNFDFGITSNSSIQLTSRGNNIIRLSAGHSKSNIRQINNITDWSNLIQLDSYLEYRLSDSVVFDLTDTNGAIANPAFSSPQFIGRASNIGLESLNAIPETNNLLSNVSRTVFSKYSDELETNRTASEIVIMNTDATRNESRTDEYNNRINIDRSLIKLYANTTTHAKFRIGQARIPVDPLDPNNAFNVFYLGQEFDTPIVGYSAVNFRLTNDPEFMGDTGAANNLLIATNSWEAQLGYNINSARDVGDEKSLSRLLIAPGFFNRQHNGNGFLSSDPNSTNNLVEYIDDGHKMLPTGSLDLYGTLRIRELGNADGTSKDNYIATNATDGIMKWTAALDIPTISNMNDNINDNANDISTNVNDIADINSILTGLHSDIHYSALFQVFTNEGFVTFNVPTAKRRNFRRLVKFTIHGNFVWTDGGGISGGIPHGVSIYDTTNSSLVTGNFLTWVTGGMQGDNGSGEFRADIRNFSPPFSIVGYIELPANASNVRLRYYWGNNQGPNGNFSPFTQALQRVTTTFEILPEVL